MIIGLQTVHTLQNNVSLRRPWKQKEISRVRKINGKCRKRRRKYNKSNIEKKIVSNLGLQTVPMQSRKTLQSGVRVKNTFHKCI